MGWRYTTFIPFTAYGGREYELHIGYGEEACRRLPERLSEDSRGNIHPIGAVGYHWGSLAEMTQDLKCEILSWHSDPGN